MESTVLAVTSGGSLSGSTVLTNRSTADSSDGSPSLSYLQQMSSIASQSCHAGTESTGRSGARDGWMMSVETDSLT